MTNPEMPEGQVIKDEIVYATAEEVAAKLKLKNQLMEDQMLRGVGDPRIPDLILDDLRNVGPNKPIGYLPISTIKNQGVDIDQLVSELGIKNLETVIVKDFLYVFHRESLTQLLAVNQNILIENNWPVDVEGFIENITHIRAESGTPLFKLIAHAFADYTNRGI
jgi:hypothetical protein